MRNASDLKAALKKIKVDALHDVVTKAGLCDEAFGPKGRWLNRKALEALLIREGYDAVFQHL